MQVEAGMWATIYTGKRPRGRTTVLWWLAAIYEAAGRKRGGGARAEVGDKARGGEGGRMGGTREAGREGGPLIQVLALLLGLIPPAVNVANACGQWVEAGDMGGWEGGQR